MMTRPRWQKILADLGGNPARSLLVIASITVGLFAIGVIATVYVVITQDMRASYNAVSPANIYIQTGLFDEDMLSSLREVEGVAEVQGVRAVDLRVLNRKDEWQAIELLSYPDLETVVLNRPQLVSGRWPPADGEIVLDQNNLSDLNVSLGDNVVVERPSGKTRELVVVGVVQDVTLGAFSGTGGFFNAPVQGYITHQTLEMLEQPAPDTLSGVYLQVAGPGKDQEAIRLVAQDAANLLENNGVSVSSNTSRESGDHPNGWVMNAIIGVLLILGLLVVFLSGFLITNTLQALLNQQMQQIGIMKTVGARRFQIAGVYILLILGFGLIAFAVSQPLSTLVSYWLLDLLSGALNFVLQGRRVIWPVFAIQGALALIMPQMAAWLPIWSGTRISVQEALSGVHNADAAELQAASAAKRATRRRTSWLKPLSRRLFSRPLLISLRNTFRRKGRLSLTLITLTLGGAVFISTFNVQISLHKWLDQIGQYFLSDVNVSLDQPYRIVEIEDLLMTVPGVKMVEGWAAAKAELIQEDGSAGDEVQLLAPPVGSSLVKPVMIEGRWIVEGDENAIVLNEVFASRFPDLRVGDTLDLRVNGEETEWTVVGFFRFAGRNGGFSAYTGYDYLSTLTNTAYKAASFQVVADRPGLSSTEQDRLAEAVSAALDGAGIEVSEINTGAYLTGIAGGGFAILTTFLLFLAGLTALVGSIGLAGTMSMNVMERTREIGVMRAIGATDQILMRMVLSEGLLIGLISYLLGVVLSFPISKLMSDGIALAVFDASSSFGFSLTGFLIWFGVVVTLSVLASVVPARSAARLTIREVLAYE